MAFWQQCNTEKTGWNRTHIREIIINNTTKLSTTGASPKCGTPTLGKVHIISLWICLPQSWWICCWDHTVKPSAPIFVGSLMSLILRQFLTPIWVSETQPRSVPLWSLCYPVFFWIQRDGFNVALGFTRNPSWVGSASHENLPFIQKKRSSMSPVLIQFCSGSRPWYIQKNTSQMMANGCSLWRCITLQHSKPGMSSLLLGWEWGFHSWESSMNEVSS